MRVIIKNEKVKIILTFCAFTVLVGALLKMNGMDFAMTLRRIYGGALLNAITMKMGFILFVILLQYFNADTILYHIRNSDYLSIRYGTKNRTFSVLVRIIITANLSFVFLS